MTNKKAIELIAEFDKHIIPCDEYGYRIYSDLMEAHLMAAKALSNAWIPVSERLPEDDLPKDSKTKQIKVLVVYKTNGRWVTRTQIRAKGYFWGDPNKWEWIKTSDPIYHWMPLPKPPE